ncbi:hypothetical protein BHM03_00013359 [Ensete ventricosum]|uniref:POX domain-containing protein n=1 Tax=Ensete ventricosum TaxID=4639 RepID=A0A445MDX3_ENSVE|nr:hypothetical protein BHM03_00013359 [Ensete ventricosum]
MAHESQYSQFLLGINPLTQSLEHNHDLLGMLEIPSRQQTSHFTSDFVHRDLPEPSSRSFLVPDAEMATAASAWPVADWKLCLPLFNVKPSDAFGVHESLQHSVSGGRLQLRAKCCLHCVLLSCSILTQVARRYRKYGEQMEGVVWSFESIAGEGSATVYLTLASTAMSKHFKRLKDGIAGQINAVRKAMGEKDASAPGMTRGETPRLKLLDQCMRQQKALQQGMAQQLPWRPQRGLPEHSVSILRAWLFEHFLDP